MPQRRQLEYPSPGSNTDHTLNLSRADKKAANQVCLCTEILVHLLQAADSTTCSDSQASANKKTARAARVPSPLNRLHSTPVAALLLGSDRNEQPHSRPTSTPGLVVLRSEAVAVEVDLKERLSKLDLELPPTAILHRQQGRLQLAQDTLATLCGNPSLATGGLLSFVQAEYDGALHGSMQDAQQASTMSASLTKTNWINSGLRSQVRTLQSRLADSNSLTAKLQREMLLVKAKAEALEFTVSEKDAEVDLLQQRQERQETQITQLMEDKEFLVAQQQRDSGGAEGSPQRTLQMRGNVMNRVLKYANEAILSAEEIRSMDEAAFVASLHDSTEASQ
ncbi:hypothetical protein ABBQ32_008170 [Trebouxia sp. C0010 RCD-2024]